MFAEAGKLITRVMYAAESGQKITFLFGSALTAEGTRPEERGVPAVDALIQEVIKTFKGTDQEINLEKDLKSANPAEKYQTAMRWVIECHGQPALNALITGAVQKARKTPPTAHQTEEELEVDADGWFLRPGVEAAGKLIAGHPKLFRPQILTSNFDPLLEVSLRKAGASSVAISLSQDGQFSNVMGTGVSVVHFHGYWRGQGSDTLHTPIQLSKARPQLKGNLRAILRDSLLIVMAYGGWSDVFTRTLLEVISEQSNELDVLWTFFSGHEEHLKANNAGLIESFGSLLGTRVNLYKGVDCHVVLPHLEKELSSSLAKSRVAPISLDRPARLRKLAEEDINEAGDYPPQTDVWVGREGELRAMLGSKAKVIAITGFGGSGKSTLAAKYLEWKQDAEEIAFFRWSDCREQSNTLHTQLVRMIERISMGQVLGSQLESSSTENVIAILFDALAQHKAVLVFDNIDQYIDLEKDKITGTMHLLVEEALRRNHSSQFIFTGRPSVEYHHASFLQLRLEGLSIEESSQLFLARGVRLDPTINSIDVMKEVHDRTQGHALALNLIATQVSKNNVNLLEFISKVKSDVGQGVAVEILTEIWTNLNVKQQTLLRYLAELVHPETEERISHYLSRSLNFHQFTKALRVLKALSLVVVKAPGQNLPAALELHPLVRDFIKKRFQKEERFPYIHSIILFCDRMIGQFRAVIINAPQSALENWTDKVQLCIECELYDDALEVLHEVHAALRKKGLSEEFVRLAVEVLSRYVPSDNQTLLAKHDTIYSALIDSLTTLGRYEEADAQIAALKKTIPSKTARYIMFCNVCSFSYFLRSDYQKAKDFASEGANLKLTTGIDTQFDCSYNLALAQRETGDIAKSLQYFLQGRTIESILDPKQIDSELRAEYYGNIARCFFYESKWDQAIICLKKSAVTLETYFDSLVLLNQGWAAFWIGEVLDKKNDPTNAYSAYKTAWIRWKSVWPIRAKEALDAAMLIRGTISDHGTIPPDDAGCELAYLAWIRKR